MLILSIELPELTGDMARLAKAFQRMARRVRELENSTPPSKPTTTEPSGTWPDDVGTAPEGEISDCSPGSGAA